MKIPYALVKLAVVISMIGVIIIPPIYKHKVHSRKLAESGVQTIITIADKFSERQIPRAKQDRHRSTRYKYCIVYEFEAQNGDGIVGEKCLKRDSYDKLKRGDKLTMTYLKDQPDINSIDYGF